MAQLNSRRIGRKHGGRSAEHMRAPLSLTHPVTGSTFGVVLNFTDGMRAFHLHLEADETAIVAAKLAKIMRGETA